MIVFTELVERVSSKKKISAGTAATAALGGNVQRLFNARALRR